MITLFNLYNEQGQYSPISVRPVVPTQVNPAAQTTQSVTDAPKSDSSKNDKDTSRDQRKQGEQPLLQSGDRGRVLNLLV